MGRGPRTLAWHEHTVLASKFFGNLFLAVLEVRLTTEHLGTE